MIRVTDAYGREFQMSKRDWRTKVFLPGLKTHWDDPQALYSQMLAGLNDGFHADLVDAARRLFVIDPDQSRGVNILGFVLLKNGHLDEAERVLRGVLAKKGPDGALLATLAKVYAQRGETTKSEEILWQAVETDPNIENSLMWWVGIQKERQGEAGYLAALNRVAALPGSWRAQLWIARAHLQAKDIQGAMDLYEAVLEAKHFHPEALRMISGDLGNAGQVGRIPDLVAPHYDSSDGDLWAGFNLLQAYLELDRLDEGEGLLSALYKRNLPPYKAQLDQYSDAFQKKRMAVSVRREVDPATLQPVAVPFTEPIWHYGLRNPEWLFQSKPKSAPVIGFVSLAKVDPPGAKAEQQREDDLGRLTRSIPLYLAEAVHHWTDRATITYLHVIAGGGPVVYGQEATGVDLGSWLPTELSHCMTGLVRTLVPGIAESELELSLKLWDRTDGSLVAQESVCVPKAELGAAVLRLESWLLGVLGGARQAPIDTCYERPTSSMMNPYLNELGVLLALTFAANQLTSVEALWGERNMLSHPLSMSLNWKESRVCRLMFLSGLSRAKDYDSKTLSEFKPQALALLQEEQKRKGVLSELAPLMFKTLSMEPEFEQAMQAAPRSPAHQAWLKRVAIGASPSE